jgi:hypothetical protein
VFEKHGINMKKYRMEGNFRLHTKGVINSPNLVVNIRNRGVWVIGSGGEVNAFSEAYCQECSANNGHLGPGVVEARRTGLSAIVCSKKGGHYNRLCALPGLLGNDIEIIDENRIDGEEIDPVLMWQMVVERKRK